MKTASCHILRIFGGKIPHTDALCRSRVDVSYDTVRFAAVLPPVFDQSYARDTKSVDKTG